MATTKKTADTAKKAETKTVAPAEKKAAPAPKKAEPKKAEKAPAKKPAAKKAPAKKAGAKKADAKVELFIQYGGATVSVADIEKNVQSVVKGKKSYTVYVKPEESKAYIVADGETTGMDVFFCE